MFVATAVIGRRLHFAGDGEDLRPYIGERHAVDVAPQQRSADFLLEPLDPAPQRVHGERGVARCRPEAHRVAHRQEGAQIVPADTLREQACLMGVPGRNPVFRNWNLSAWRPVS